MLGTLLNTAAILACGMAGLRRVPDPPLVWQRRLSLLLGVLTLVIGFHAFWRAVTQAAGGAFQAAGQALLAFVLGRWTGGLLQLQRRLNRLGVFSNRVLRGPDSPTPGLADVFAAASVVFCLGPLAVLGPAFEALAGDVRVLAIKAGMDGLAAVTLSRTRGPGVVMAALPVLALQGTLTLGLKAASPAWAAFGGGQIICATAGLMLWAVALVMLQVVRVRLADYLPALVWAPLLAWVFR